ncbi:MAG: EAL domain-containing protein [Acidimicrobiia bacterium]|nr:EAL domain-containing protein [Acidimicrobiia bacterium]
MHLTASQSGFVAVQLGLSGLTLGLAVDQALAWRRGHSSSLRWMALTSFALAALLAANVALAEASPGWPADLALFLRAVALSVTGVLVVITASSIGNVRTPRWLVSLVAALAAWRIVLWVGSDLLYAHHWSHGVPVYGPLLLVVNLPFMALAFGYLWAAALRGGTTSESITLVAGVSVSVLVAALSLAVSDKVAAELLTGFVAAPLTGAGLVIFALRLDRSHRAQCLASARHQAMADLTRDALTRSLYELCDDVEEALRSSLPAARCEVTLDSSAVTVAASPGRLSVPVPGSLGADGAVTVVRQDPFDVEDLTFVEAAAHLLGSARERQRAEDRIRHQALHDELTGLASRMLVRDRLSNAVRNAARTRERVAVVLVDIDGFKAVNDLHGHAAGDNLLWQLSRRLSETLEAGQTLGRFGGDEFVVICEGVSDDAAIADIATRILAATRVPLDVPTGSTRVTASVGIVVSEASDDPDTLLRDAGLAVRRAKDRSGDTAEVFNLALRRQVLALVDTQEALTFAVELGEIVAHFQPIVDLETGQVVRLEALARWRRGSRLLPPDEWMPIAEHTGAIAAIGCEMLRQAIAHLARWLQSHPDLVMAVNVSPLELAGPDLLNSVAQAFADGLPAGRLCLEVAESAAIDDPAAIEGMRTLRSVGCQVALDDFGVGYSSLAALGRLPVDVVKIDQAFVRTLSTPDGAALVAAVITLAKALGLQVIAEGIETEEQRQKLIELGCTEGQGFLISPPGPPEVIWPPAGPR